MDQPQTNSPRDMAWLMALWAKIDLMDAAGSLSAPTTTNADEGSKDREWLAMIPGELRNLVYENYFPALPATKTPLITAPTYRPSSALTCTSKGFATETTGYLTAISTAWQATHWTVDLDRFYLPIDLLTGDGAQRAEDITRGLSDADAARIWSIEFRTSEFALPASEVEGVETLSEAFVFRVRRRWGNKLVVESPTFDACFGKDEMVVDGRVAEVLLRVHESLCSRQAVERQREGGGRLRPWTAEGIRRLLMLLEVAVEEASTKRPELAEMGRMREALDWRGVWEGNMPEKGLKLSEMGAFARERSMWFDEALWEAPRGAVVELDWQGPHLWQFYGRGLAGERGVFW